MKSVDKMKTATCGYTEDGSRYYLAVSYGMRYIEGNRLPYFSITAKTEVVNESGRWVENSCGCLHDEITKHLPNLAPLIKWHLCFQDGTPWYYFENGKFWFERIGAFEDRKPYDPDPEKAFKSLVHFGLIEGEEMPKPENLYAWMSARLPVVKAAFKKDMEAFGIEFITMPEKPSPLDMMKE